MADQSKRIEQLEYALNRAVTWHCKCRSCLDVCRRLGAGDVCSCTLKENDPLDELPRTPDGKRCEICGLWVTDA